MRPLRRPAMAVSASEPSVDPMNAEPFVAVPDCATPDRICVGQGLWQARLLRFARLPSTQTWARRNPPRLRHGDTVLAVRQTDGYGRFGRGWQAGADGSVTFSVVLKTPDERLRSGWLCSCAAVALCKTLHEEGIAVKLKWPNDVTTARGKIAGILAESLFEADTVVLGIGLNVNLTPNELAAIPTPATSLRVETGRVFAVDNIRRLALKNLAETLDRAGGPDTGEILAYWARHDALTGRRIALQTTAGQTVAGVYGGMTADGALRMTDDGGTERVFWSGDVTLRKT
jgi:BirA family transcriptional regulator, biotin operon repressor / biotin---[acetyl-CoA-carboxylase] ligase